MSPIIEVINDSPKIWHVHAQAVASSVAVMLNAKALKSKGRKEEREVVVVRATAVRIAMRKQDTRSRRNRAAGGP